MLLVRTKRAYTVYSVNESFFFFFLIVYYQACTKAPLFVGFEFFKTIFKGKSKFMFHCLRQGTILLVVMQHLIIQQKKGTKAQINPDHRRSQGARAPPIKIPLTTKITTT